VVAIAQDAAGNEMEIVQWEIDGASSQLRSKRAAASFG